MNNEFLIFAMTWLSSNVPQLVELLHALLPVLAVVVAGLAVRVLDERRRKDTK